MHPKTYQVRLFRPFGLSTVHPYIFKVHAGSARDALGWVARVFTGIDVQTTLDSWSRPRDVVRIGNTDPVSVTDCDAYRRHEWVRGKRVAVETPEGFFRVSAEEVTADLLRLFKQVQEEYARCLRTFEHFSQQYEAQGLDWHYERLVEAKEGAQRALVWMNNLWVEYLATQTTKELVLPQRRLAA